MSTLTTSQPTKHLFRESEMESPELVTVGDATVAVFCRRCPDKEEPNDDSAAVIEVSPTAVVLVVADGVGGCPMGHKASAIAVESVCEALSLVADGDELRPAILDGIETASAAILDLNVGAATTITVVEINDGIARAYQVGDSMAVILGQRGALKWKTTPHSPVGYAIESGMLEEEEAMQHDERHIVSNLVGSRNMHIEIGPRQKLAARDTVIVGSDGLFDNLHLDEVIELGKNGKPLTRMEVLTSLATSRMTTADEHSGKPDDLSVLLYTSR